MKRFLCLCLICVGACLQAFEYDLSVCAIFRDEARFLREWLEFHKLVGVQHFYLYNNLSQDAYLEVLTPYIENGEVELIEFPYPSSNQLEFNSVQIAAYDHALLLSREKTQWLAAIDTDEFLYPVNQENVLSILKRYESHGGVEVNWQMFGTSSVKEIPEHQLLIETLVLRADRYFQSNHNVKSIVQPHLVEKCLGAHNFSYQAPYSSVYTNHCSSVQTPLSPFIEIDVLILNHYWTRDEKFLNEVKIPRYQNWQHHLNFVKKVLPSLNQERDETMFRFISPLKEAMEN